MKYEKDLMASWDQYAMLKSAKEEGMEEGMEKGKETKSYEVVKKLLLTKQFKLVEIANFASVSESFVHKVEKSLKK